MINTASALIIENKRILLVQRSHDDSSFPSFWCCPGGHAEENESVEQAVAREVMEETNLNFTPKKLFAVHPFNNRLMHRFLGDFSGTITLQPSELCGYGWFTYEQAILLPLAFEYKLVLEKLRQEKLL